MSLGCENCKNCYKSCKDSFPEKYIEGGAEACQSFENEPDSGEVIKNMERKCDEIRKHYAAKGIYV